MGSLAAEEVEDGWSFWTRVYSDPTLRAELESLNQDEPTISELLSGEKLHRTRVHVDNLPKQCSEVEISNLLEAELGGAKVMKVHVGQRFGGVVDFYLASDAEAAVSRFHNRMFRGRPLKLSLHTDANFAESPGVQSSSSNCDQSSNNPEVEQSRSAVAEGEENSYSQSAAILEHQENAETFATTADDQRSLNEETHIGKEDWKVELKQLLEDKGPLPYNSFRISVLLDEKMSVFEKESFETWPLGFFRTMSDFQLVGQFLCLPEDEVKGYLLCETNQTPYVFAEPWEPIAPSQISSIDDFHSYIQRFLANFGPLWLHAIRFKYLMKSVPSGWRCALQLMQQSLALGLHTVSVQDTIYLTTIPEQRQAAEKSIRRGCL